MSGAYDYDLLCIGSGPAGQRAAVQAAKLGKRVAVVERQRVVGGACLGTGTIPSKTFREAVLPFAHPFARPEPSQEFHTSRRPSIEHLLTRVQQVIRRETEIIEDQLSRNDVTMIRGDASFKDPHTIQVVSDHTSRLITADKILVAVGTVPTSPPGAQADGEVVLISDGMMNLQRLPKTMTVVGAGVIGIEYASMFAALEIEVIVVDKRERPLEFLDREIVDELIHQMRTQRVTFRFGETVERLEVVEGPPRRAVVLLESGKRIVSDLVLFSVGRIGATASLNLDKAGLSADERCRIKVNQQFQSKIPHIFAAGDVIGFPSLAATSSEQGRLAACYAFGLEAQPMPPHFPIGIYAIPEISMVGDPEHVLTEKKIPYETGEAWYREIARGQISGDESGFLKLIFHRENHRLLGVHIIGTGATELVHIGQAILGTGGGLEYFLKTVFNYPTLAECYKVAALDAYNKLSQ